MGGWKGKLIVVVMAVGLTVFALEVLIHLVEARTGPLFFSGLSNPEYNPDFVQPHPVLGVEHVPESTRAYGFPEHPRRRIELRTNNLGLREDAPTAYEKPEGVYRVLVLGDSQTDGLVYNDESFVNVAEARLNEDIGAGPRIEMLNAGVITYQPVQYYLWWQTYGRGMEPDLVLAVFYTGNDLLDASRTRIRRDEEGDWIVDDGLQSTVQPSAGRRLLRQCRTCALASLPLRGGPAEQLLARLGLVRSSSMNASAYIQSHRRCRGCIWQSLNQPHRYATRPDQFEEDLQATGAIFDRIAVEAHEAGAKFGLVVLPSKLQVEGDVVPETAEVAALLGLEAYLPPLEVQVEDRLIEIARAAGWLRIELGPALRAAYTADGQALYYSIDWHLNPAGNLAAGQALSDGLNEMLPW